VLLFSDYPGLVGVKSSVVMKNVYKIANTIHTCKNSMTTLSIDILFDAAVRIQLLERSITIAFADNTIRMKFPTTRRLAEFLDVPHYYVLPYFAMMEQEELVTRAERVGILTTAKGSRKMIELMQEKYPKESSEILGTAIFEEILRKI
jgi:DNA-binding transcriptional regulator YhcF (GntR family)